MFQIDILMPHIILQKSLALPLISGLQADRVFCAAIQRTCCTTVAVGTDLKVKPKVCRHPFADLCQHSRVRLSFWDIRGRIRTLQPNKSTLQSLVSLKCSLSL